MAVTLGEWYEYWLDTYMKDTVKQSTYTSYRSYLNKHFCVLGKILLKKLEPHTLQELYNYKFREEGLSPKTLRNYHMAMHKCLQQAVKERLLVYNPCDAVTLPSGEKPEIVVFTDDDGKLKEPHIHLIIKMKDAYDVSTIGGYVGVSKNFVCKIRQKRPAGKRMVSDVGGAISYLTHRNAPGKHQYDDKEVIAQPGYDWKSIRAESEAWHAQNKNYRNVLTKIEAGEVRRYNLMDYISMQMYLDHKTDFEKAFEYRESKLKSSTDREMDVIYIYGEPGAGKTTLAKDICDKRGYSYCLSGSSRDPVQDYGGQDALILDDLRPEAFSLSDLLKMLDNNSASSVSARYHDRWLEVKLIIITTVLPIDDFHASYENPSEPVEQLKRRCKQMIELRRSQMYVYRYDAISQSYRLFGQGKNSIPERYQTEALPQEEELQKFCSDLNISYVGGQPCYEDVTDKIDTSLFTGIGQKG